MHKQLRMSGLKAGPRDGLDEGQFTAYASTFDAIDSYGDKVTRGAFAKSLTGWQAKGDPIPLLFGHNMSDPDYNIGHVVDAKEDDHGLLVTAQLDLENPKAAQVYRLIKGRRISDLSFAYDVIAAHDAKADDGTAYTALDELELHEVSVVPIGANRETGFVAVKQAPPTRHLAATTAILNVKAGRFTMPKTDTRSPWEKDRDNAIEAAQTLLDGAKSAGRDLTDTEQQKVEQHLEAARKSDEHHHKAMKSTALMRQLEGMAADDGLPPGAKYAGIYSVDTPAGPVAGKRLSFCSKGTGGLAAKAARAMTDDAPLGIKASLAPTGAAIVGQEFTPDPIAEGKPATGILDVLPVIAHPSPEYAYLWQTSRDNKAAVVAEGATKPTSTYGLERVDGRLDVIAHLSEPIPQYWLTDNAALQTFIGNEMQYGLQVAVEALVPAAITAQTGTQSQAYAADLLATTRAAITKVEALGYGAGAFVLRPEDWELVELATASGSGEYVLASSPVDRAARKLWGVPVAVSSAPTAGVGYLLGDGALALDTDTQGVKVEWSSAVGDDFSKNQTRARVEGRYAVGIRQPQAIVQIATVKAGG